MSASRTIIIAFIAALAASPAYALNRGPAVDYVATARAVATDPTLSPRDRLDQLEKIRAQLEGARGLRGRPESDFQSDAEWTTVNELVHSIRLAFDNSEIQKNNESLRKITSQVNDLVLQGADGAEIQKLKDEYTHAYELKTQLLKNLSEDTDLFYGQSAKGGNRVPATADEASSR